MKKVFGEFKKFIMRGNIVDMAVGVIVGSSFTAIVNALSNNILKPVINYLLFLAFGADSLSDIFTFFVKAEKDVIDEATGAVIGKEVDLASSIYIDWGAFVNAVINFLLVAAVLFTIVKIVNTLRDGHKKFVSEIMDDFPTKADIKAMRKAGIKLYDEEAVKEFMAQKKKAEEEKAAKEKAEAEEKARLERLNNPTTEDLLKEILAEIKSK